MFREATNLDTIVNRLKLVQPWLECRLSVRVVSGTVVSYDVIMTRYCKLPSLCILYLSRALLHFMDKVPQIFLLRYLKGAIWLDPSKDMCVFV